MCVKSTHINIEIFKIDMGEYLKTTCNTCGGSIVLPNLKMGSSIPCPYCGKSISTSLEPTGVLLKTVIRTIWRRPTKRTITGIFGGLLLTFCIYLTFRFYSLGFRSNDDDIDGVNTVTMFVFLDILLLGVCLHCFGILPFASGLSLNGRGNDELRKFLPQKVDYHRKFGRSPRKKSLLRGAITWIVAGLGCFWLIGFIGDKTGIFNDPRMDAYDAAINFTKQNY